MLQEIAQARLKTKGNEINELKKELAGIKWRREKQDGEAQKVVNR